MARLGVGAPKEKAPSTTDGALAMIGSLGLGREPIRAIANFIAFQFYECKLFCAGFPGRSKFCRETGAGVGSAIKRSAPMHDVYNFIVVDHLDLTIGAGGFVLGWITGNLRRRRPKPAGVEAHVALDYYGVD